MSTQRRLAGPPSPGSRHASSRLGAADTTASTRAHVARYASTAASSVSSVCTSSSMWCAPHRRSGAGSRSSRPRRKCFISQSSVVPLSTSGRRAASSSTPATFRTNESRWYCRSAMQRLPLSGFSRGGFWYPPPATLRPLPPAGRRVVGQTPPHRVSRPVRSGRWDCCWTSPRCGCRGRLPPAVGRPGGVVRRQHHHHGVVAVPGLPPDRFLAGGRPARRRRVGAPAPVLPRRRRPGRQPRQAAPAAGGHRRRARLLGRPRRQRLARPPPALAGLCPGGRGERALRPALPGPAIAAALAARRRPAARRLRPAVHLRLVRHDGRPGGRRRHHRRCSASPPSYGLDAATYVLAVVAFAGLAPSPPRPTRRGPRRHRSSRACVSSAGASR